MCACMCMCEKGVEKAKGEKWRVSKPPLPALYCALYCAHTYTDSSLCHY